MLAGRINFASAIAAIPSNFRINYNVLLSSIAIILDIYKNHTHFQTHLIYIYIYIYTHTHMYCVYVYM